LTARVKEAHRGLDDPLAAGGVVAIAARLRIHARERAALVNDRRAAVRERDHAPGDRRFKLAEYAERGLTLTGEVPRGVNGEQVGLTK
jgi:hypothetical protein